MSAVAKERLIGSGPIQLLDQLFANARGTAPSYVWALSAISLVAVGTLDLLTGTDIWFGPVYLIVIAFVALIRGSRCAIAVSLACGCITISANGAAAFPHTSRAFAWNMSMRLLVVCIIIALVSGLRRSYEKERQRARMDSLTGLLNRQAFYEDVAHHNGRTCGVLAYIDLDGFKQINDDHGHAAGDETLCDFAEGARRIIRSGDLVARVGGDEFLLFLPVSDELEGHRLVRNLHSRMNGMLADFRWPIRCSMGAAILNEGRCVTEQDVRHADRLMYEAKREGAALRISEVTTPLPLPPDRLGAATV